MTSHDNSRFKKVNLDARQLRAFDKMYVDRSYSMSDIRERFGISEVTIEQLARERNLGFRLKPKK